MDVKKRTNCVAVLSLIHTYLLNKKKKKSTTKKKKNSEVDSAKKKNTSGIQDTARGFSNPPGVLHFERG